MQRTSLVLSSLVLLVAGCGKEPAAPEPPKPAPGVSAEPTVEPTTTAPAMTADEPPASARTPPAPPADPPATTSPSAEAPRGSADRGADAPTPAAPGTTASRPQPPLPSDPEERVALYTSKVEEYTTKIRGLNMAAGFLNDEQFTTLVSRLSEKVEEADAKLVEIGLADEADRAGLMAELDTLMSDMVSADEAAVERLRQIRGK